MFRTTEVQKADQLAQCLVGGATEAAKVIAKMARRPNGSFRDENNAQQFIIEVMVFYMHLVDRLAFAHLGAAKREIFMDRFLDTVLKETLPELSNNVSPEDFAESLRETYNCRQKQYADHKLVPVDDEPPKETLCWEFSKILFGFLDTVNPITFALLHKLVLQITTVMLKDTLKVEEVLGSSAPLLRVSQKKVL